MTLQDAPRMQKISQALQGRRRGLIPNLLAFCRMLRTMGMDITTGKVIDVCASLKHIDITRKDDFYYTLRTNLISRYEHIEAFDRAFRLFWEPFGPLEGLEDALADESCGGESPPLMVEESGMREAFVEDWAEGQPEPGLQEWLVPAYSAEEVLAEKDFSSFSDEDVVALRRLIAQIAPKIATTLSRRRHPNPKGREIDLRRSLRRNLRYGGEIMELCLKKRKIRKLKLVLLCDVSGSMDCYSRFLIQFIYALQQELKGLETFVFSTRLTRITNILKRKNIYSAFEELARSVLDWSGGTTIGSCLEAFNKGMARGLVGVKTVVVIISDGWDRGDAQLLEKQMRALQRRAYKIIWLNPLLGSSSYQPLCKGIKAVLPHTDYFLPAHNLQSLVALGKTLHTLSKG